MSLTPGPRRTLWLGLWRYVGGGSHRKRFGFEYSLHFCFSQTPKEALLCVYHIVEPAVTTLSFDVAVAPSPNGLVQVGAAQFQNWQNFGNVPSGKDLFLPKWLVFSANNYRRSSWIWIWIILNFPTQYNVKAAQDAHFETNIAIYRYPNALIFINSLSYNPKNTQEGSAVMIQSKSVLWVTLPVPPIRDRSC